MTEKPSANRRSHIWEPRKPAAPETSARGLEGRSATNLILNVDQVHSLLQSGNGIVPLFRRVLVGDETGKTEVGDRLRDERVVQLLRFVDVVTARIPAGMEVADPLVMIADIADNIAVHDLRVIDVV